MLRSILPITLILASGAVLLVFLLPSYNKVTELRAQVVSKNASLDQSRVLEKEREELTNKYNEISLENKDRLEKLLPDNVDNIRLIIEINDVVAAAYGMQLKDIKYDASKESSPTGKNANGQPVQASAPAQNDGNDYGTWNLEFSTEGSYGTFLNFLNALEHNLRMVDIAAIKFDSVVEKDKKNPGDVYKYSFKVKTYWLKN